MAAFVPKVFLQPKWQPSTQFLRYRKRINIQRPAKPHYVRAEVLYVCRPMFITPEKTMTLPELCQKPNEIRKTKTEVDNPYKTLLARDLLNWCNHSYMIMFYHTNPIKADEFFKAQVLFKRQNMTLRSYGRSIANIALGGTKYDATLELFSGPISMAFGPEQQMSKVIRITRKVPQLILLAGIIDGRLLSKNEVLQYSRLPDLQTCRAQLVATLNLAATQLVEHLTYHQCTLVGHLEKHIELQSAKEKTDS